MTTPTSGSRLALNVPAIPDVVLGTECERKAITIDYNFPGYLAAGLPGVAGDGIIRANALYGRQTTGGKYAPFLWPNAVVTSYVGGGPTFDVPDADAAKLMVRTGVGAGPNYVLWDVSAAALMAGAADVFEIVSIGAAGSGTGGAGFTLVTIDGALTTTPGAGDRVVLADGTALPQDAVVVDSEVDLRTTAPVPITSDVVGAGIYEARVDLTKVWNYPAAATEQTYLRNGNHRLMFDTP